MRPSAYFWLLVTIVYFVGTLSLIYHGDGWVAVIYTFLSVYFFTRFRIAKNKPRPE